MPLRRPAGAVPATLWRGPAIRFVRALGWLVLSPDRLEWHPLVRAPFFRSIDIPVAEIASARLGGIFIGPDLRIETTSGEILRFTVWRRELVRRWVREAGIAVD